MRHRRLAPVHNEFQYRLFMQLVDLDELAALFDPFWLWFSAPFYTHPQRAAKKPRTAR